MPRIVNVSSICFVPEGSEPEAREEYRKSDTAVALLVSGKDEKKVLLAFATTENDTLLHIEVGKQAARQSRKQISETNTIRNSDIVL